MPGEQPDDISVYSFQITAQLLLSHLDVRLE